uniref:Nucleotide-diphospho-sugar transferase domain-containing protein n=2 Tax=Pyrodinium bahamense TaxID=73915 RepID=A0A7S0FC88_9DINO
MAEMPLLWSCGFQSQRGRGEVDEQLDAAVQRLCTVPELAGMLEIRLDTRFEESHLRWADRHSGWLSEAFITYMAGKKHSKFAWMATNLIRSVHLFSTRPIVVVNFDKVFQPPESWLGMPNLVVYRMRPLADVNPRSADVSFNFNKIRAMIAARVVTGIQLDLDQVIFAGMDSLFAATRRESTQQHPYPVLPVHWMSRDAKKGEPYHVYQFTAYPGKHSMRWNHAHPTWTTWALPFLSELLYERLTAHPEPRWMMEDEDMLNVMLWKHNVTKAWCKFDLEPSLYMERLPSRLYDDPYWYPAGLPVLFFSAHNTKHIGETDELLTLMARCADPVLRAQVRCPAGGVQRQSCDWHLMPQTQLEALLSASEEDAASVCCCVKAKEDTPIFWQGEWFREGSQVPRTDRQGRTRSCVMP